MNQEEMNEIIEKAEKLIQKYERENLFYESIKNEIRKNMKNQFN